MTARSRRHFSRSATRRLAVTVSMWMLAAATLPATASSPSSPETSAPGRKPAVQAELPGIARSFHPGPPEDDTVYRCGNSYSPTPCAKAQPLAVADPRTEEQRLQGQDVAARQKRMAAWLEAERHEREKVAPVAASAPKRKAATRPKKNCVPTPRTACIAKPPQPRTVILKAPAAQASATPQVK